MRCAERRSRTPILPTLRSSLLAALATALIGIGSATPAVAQAPGMSRVSAHAFAFSGIDGADMRLAGHAGKPILIVNTASLCGYTPQYAGLEELWGRFKDRGLLVIGVPSNDFGGQEPGQAADILKTAHAEYHVTFPMMAKASVKGSGAHPFYRWAAAERPLETPRWNFHKYLIGRDGRIAHVFERPSNRWTRASSTR